MSDEPKVEETKSLLSQMSDLMFQIETRKAAYVELAREREVCRGCGQLPQDVRWVGLMVPGGIMEKLLCQCEQGHEWYATTPWPEETP